MAVPLAGGALLGRVGEGESGRAEPLRGEIVDAGPEIRRGIEIPAYSPGAPEYLEEEVVEEEVVEEDAGVIVFRPGMTMDEIERNAIAAALDEVRGNRRKAAEMLGIGERTLYRKIKEYGLT